MEFGGPGLAALSPDERATLANMATECSAKAGVVEADEAMLRWLADAPPGRRRSKRCAPRCVAPDPGAQYAGRRARDRPRRDAADGRDARRSGSAASRPTRRTARYVAELGEVPIDIAYGGSCTAGKGDDLDIYARVMARGRSRRAAA